MKANVNNKKNQSRYNKSEILKRAWKIFKSENNDKNFGDCLRESWSIAKNGNNVSTFEEIYKKYNKQLYYFILAMIKNEDSAKEILQDVFMRLDRHFEEYDVYKAKISTWLHTIAKNLVIDYIRKEKQTRNTVNVSDYVDSEGNEFFIVPDSSKSSGLVENKEISVKIELAFANLSPKLKKIAELYFIEEKQYLEISDILNMPMGSVKGYINRIRLQLQTELKQVYQTIDQ